MIRPRIGVVVPLFNKGAYVQNALRSALAQAPAVAEVVVIDDGSTDGGAERVREIDEPRVRLFSQANSGVAAARNRGVAECSSDVIAFLDADDWYLPGFTAAVAEMSNRFPQAAVYATAYRRHSVDDTDLETQERDARNAAPQAFLLDNFYRQWARAPMFFTSSLCVKREALLASRLGFPVGERLGEDQDLWFQLAERFAIAYCPWPLAVYRVGVAGSATIEDRSTATLPCYERLAARLRNGVVPAHLRWGARKLLASHVLNVARSLAERGRKADALRMALDSRAFGNPAYWLRSVARVVMARNPSFKSS
jgi:glycosyltransferase involved in cell wall biosynthesis